MLQDLRYALRALLARPGFTAVAVLSLALGIGANTAIFSLWNGLLHASLPGVHDPGGLVILSNPDDSGSWTGRWDGRTDGPRSWLTYGEFEQLRDHARSFTGLMASQSSLGSWQARVSGGGPEPIRGRLVSGGFFQVLGVKSAIGRLFTTDEDRADTPSVVISHHFWQRRFGGQPDVIGRTIAVRNLSLSIIGVAPAGFVGETIGQQPDVWIPLRMQPAVLPDRDRLHDTPPEKAMWLHVFGRLAPGVTLPQADSEANAIFQAGLEAFYGPMSGERRREYLDQQLRLQPGGRGASAKRTEFSRSLTMLLAGVGILLLIACANLANLLLARGAARTSEIAVRLSLGASRGRLVRQLVTESLVLAVAGGVAALVVASFFHDALVRMIAESDERFAISFALDPRVLTFLLATTVGATLLFGVIPALQVTKTEPGAALKDHARGGSARGQARSGRVLVSVQLALSLPLLVGAGLLARTAYNLQRADLGFPADHLLLVRVDLRDAARDEARRDSLRRELLDRIGRVPGVRAVSFSQLGVFSGGESSSTIAVEGYVPRGDNDRGSRQDVVGPRYFSTLGIPIIAGREILDSDRASSLEVTVVNEAFARQFFEKRNPIGMHVTIVEDDNSRKTYEIVGVTANARTQRLRGDIAPRQFLSAAQPPNESNSPTFLIRTASADAPVLAAVRSTIQRLDASLAIQSAGTLADEMAPLTAQDRTTARLAVVFGSVALALAVIGLYGVLSYGVARRTREIGIRIALGAQPARVVSMVLGETAGIVAGGLVLGGTLAFAVSRLIGSRLYGVAPHDPLTLSMATLVLLAAALAAAYLPARRASRVDPITALRQE